VFVIGLTKFVNLQSPAAKAIDLLKGLAEHSGGRALFPNSPSDVPESLRAISHDLQAQFVIDYRASNKPATPEPGVQVKWMGRADAGDRKVTINHSVVTKLAAQP
jgi:hypothetical protein